MLRGKKEAIVCGKSNDVNKEKRQNEINSADVEPMNTKQISSVVSTNAKRDRTLALT